MRLIITNTFSQEPGNMSITFNIHERYTKEQIDAVYDTLMSSKLYQNMHEVLDTLAQNGWRTTNVNFIIADDEKSV